MPAQPKGSKKDKSASKTEKKAEESAPEKVSTPPAPASVATKPVENASTAVASGSKKPDQAAYNAEQEAIKKDIDQLNVKLSAVRDKISLATAPGPNADRKNTLKAELDSIRESQGDVKSNREKTFNQLQSIQDGIKKKVSDLQAKKGGLRFKTIEELDLHQTKLEAAVESGTLSVLAEKRQLQDIAALKRQRKAIESLQADQDAIDDERARADEIRKELDNPESKALSERYDTIKTELDAINQESGSANAERSKLFEERDVLQKEMDALYTRKRESSQRHREASDNYYSKLQEDRQKRAERARAQRQAFEDEKKKEIVERLRDEADAPAYQAEIEDCQTLIDFFSGNVSAGASGLDLKKAELASVPKLQPRTVDTDMKGMIQVKQDDEDYFAATKKGKKKGAAKVAPTAEATPASDRFSVPLAKLSALASLSIPPPTNASEIPHTIENLKTKKEWLVANQAKQTAANKAKAEKEIASLLRSINAHSLETSDAREEDAEITAPQPVAA